MSHKRLRLGLILNPVAGVGGPAGLKGSDGVDVVKLALARGVSSKVAARVTLCLEALLPVQQQIDIIAAPGPMGAMLCQQIGLSVTALEIPVATETSAADTRQAVLAMQLLDIDLLVFAGGDGTARDIFDVVQSDQVVLGIPCGVKMHSGVFANNPLAAGQIILQMIAGKLVTVMRAEVRDIDEAGFRQDIVRTQYYGELWVPEELRFVQQVKSGAKEDETLLVAEIAADVIEHMHPDTIYFVGSGSTTAEIMSQLDLPNTLLGVDVISDGVLLQADAHEAQLFNYTSQADCVIIITVIGGQGIILGRGNQQLSPRVVEAVGIENLSVIATKTKLQALQQSLLVDSGDPQLDAKLSGYIRITTGYEDTVLCAVRN
ncbi:MAG: ATP-NAD kinase family protein [Pseudomonadales bacterium]|nr:ATP-NAD kinase family protein [Pseudomonadales bacterium]